MSLPVYISSEIETIVTKVSDKLQTQLGKEVQYMFGHPLEIVKRLQDKDSSLTQKGSKYPLIALFADFRIERGDRLDMYGKTRLNLIIANDTKPEYIAPFRYTANFIPVLYPIYTEFLNQLRLHTQFEFKNQDEIKHDVIERLFWGKSGLYGNSGNMFNDYIDCIEIQSLEITIRKKQNC